MKTIKPMLFATAIILISFSCRKKDNHPPEKEKKILLTKYRAATFVRTYSYDENNRTTGYVNSEGNPENNYTVAYTYNSSGQLADVHYDNPGSTNDFKNSYFYNSNGQITKIETYLVGDGIATFESKTEADYSAPGKISSYHTPNGGLPKLVTEFYLDSKGNITRQLSYSTEGFLLVTTENADFDDKHSPTASLPQTAYARSANNYQKVTTTITGGTPSTGTYTYEYNSDGYPTKRTSNTGVIYTYEYIKK